MRELSNRGFLLEANYGLIGTAAYALEVFGTSGLEPETFAG